MTWIIQMEGKRRRLEDLQLHQGGVCTVDSATNYNYYYQYSPSFKYGVSISQSLDRMPRIYTPSTEHGERYSTSSASPLLSVLRLLEICPVIPIVVDPRCKTLTGPLAWVQRGVRCFTIFGPLSLFGRLV